MGNFGDPLAGRMAKNRDGLQFKYETGTHSLPKIMYVLVQYGTSTIPYSIIFF